jgi:putative restriction endonuclease
VKAYVGVTDGDWYRFLAARPTLNEVNFWRPSGGRAFRVLTPGEPFFFKTHHPHNRVVGGGFFSGFAELRISEAWEFFGQANGTATLEEMRQRVGRYRRTPIGPGKDPVIGCIFVRDIAFLPPDTSVDPPPDFAPNIVQGKSYDLSDLSARSYFEDLLRHLLGVSSAVDLGEPWHRPGPTYGDPRLVPRRLGQNSFQAVVLQAYGRRCAITGAKIRPVLQAAHIRPLSQGGEHRLDNGLLLRSDMHTLYDGGYIGVDPKHRLVVSPRLREEFHNGDDLYARAGNQISLPERRADRPSREFIEWHLDEVFLNR